jgi:predicted small lipoprotein YifL
MSNLSAPHGLRLLFAFSAIGLLTACGVRGALEAPADAKTAGTAVSSEAADPGKDSAVKAKPPFKPFVLDSLIR